MLCQGGGGNGGALGFYTGKSPYSSYVGFKTSVFWLIWDFGSFPYNKSQRAGNSLEVAKNDLKAAFRQGCFN